MPVAVSSNLCKECPDDYLGLLHVLVNACILIKWEIPLFELASKAPANHPFPN